ncbi:hypothetical protein KVR01_005738 [Diaporthe batatas]|uniref:uncharacterized protein n=1 Tax=Diaporthe batatas TaxID=748121 RepID=UPI001D059EA8|nr:uncharacterized protein KVR01_005738 [Diaporthe batatas]KAG8163820.1 hypothetical protein KVR01_005738 [Diaporthe batatas]
MGGHLAESASEKTTQEDVSEPTALPLNSLRTIPDYSRRNSNETPDGPQLGHTINPDTGNQDQLAIFATTPHVEAAADVPYHVFRKRTKYLMVALIGVAGTLSGLTSSTYFPEFDISHQLTSLTITTYSLMQGIGVLLWGTLSDKLGRRQAYIYSFIVCLVANGVLSGSPNLPIIFVFRGLQAFGSASVISIGSGFIQDIAPPIEIGGFLSIYQALRMFGMAVGPVMGGALAQRFGFRSIFIALAIFNGLILVMIIVVLPETLRSVVGNGSARVKGFRYKPLWDFRAGGQSDTASPYHMTKQKIKLRDFLEPLCMLRDKNTLFCLVLGGVACSMWSMMNGTTTMILEERFSLSELDIGLAYLANGSGTCLGSVIPGWLMNRDFRSTEARYRQAHGMPDESNILLKAIPSDFPIEKARLRHVFWIIVMLSLSVVLYGLALLDSFTTSRRRWIAVLLVLQFFIAVFANMIFALTSCLMTDLYPGKGASATAISNLARSTLSAGAVPLVHYMIKGIGAMPSFCALGGGVLVLCMSAAAVSRTYGMKWRAET